MLALATTGITLLTFIFTTLIQEPASIVTLLAMVGISLGLDVVWARMREGQDHDGRIAFHAVPGGVSRGPRRRFTRSPAAIHAVPGGVSRGRCPRSTR